MNNTLIIKDFFESDHDFEKNFIVPLAIQRLQTVPVKRLRNATAFVLDILDLASCATPGIWTSGMKTQHQPVLVIGIRDKGWRIIKPKCGFAVVKNNTDIEDLYLFSDQSSINDYCSRHGITLNNYWEDWRADGEHLRTKLPFDPENEHQTAFLHYLNNEQKIVSDRITAGLLAEESETLRKPVSPRIIENWRKVNPKRKIHISQDIEKYMNFNPRNFRQGDTIIASQNQEPVEFDNLLQTLPFASIVLKAADILKREDDNKLTVTPQELAEARKIMCSFRELVTHVEPRLNVLLQTLQTLELNK